MRSTAHLAADAQGLANADGTRGGYWKEVVISKYSFVNIEDCLQTRWAGRPMAVRTTKYSTIRPDILCPTLDVFYLRVRDIKSVVVYPDSDMYDVQVAGIKREVFPGLIPQ